MTRLRERSDAVEALLPHAGWVAELADGAVYASLYSAPEATRDGVATRFVNAGLPIHLDVIISRDERRALVHLGIAPEAIESLGRQHPDALLEVHVIVLADSVEQPDVRAEIARVIASAAHVGAQRVALPTPFASDRSLSDAFRAAGGEIWSVVNPEDEPAAHRHLDGEGAASGTLVMLIEPGTRQAARPELLARVAELAPSTRVSVDGGVDAALAARALGLGAHHVVVGRALLGPTPQSELSASAPQGEPS